MEQDGDKSEGVQEFDDLEWQGRSVDDGGRVGGVRGRERLKKKPVRFPIGFPWELSTSDALNFLLHLGEEGRIVGVNVYRAMNLCLWNLTPEEAIQLGKFGEVRFVGFHIKQTRFLQWEVSDGKQYARVLDLKKWAPRGWSEKDCPVALYRDILATGKWLGVHPRMFYSLSQLAAPILRNAKVYEHLPGKGWELRELAEEAFHVGRIQSCRIGHLEKSRYMYEYDLNSAYAWGLSQVPSLRDCIVTEGEPTTVYPWALQKISWDLGKSPVYPLPARVDGKVRYDRKGEGWYWSPMVNEAKRHFHLKVIQSYRLETASAVKPFAFLNDLYNIRRQIKRAEQRDIAKRTLSAIWGKTCERAGRGFLPRFRCLEWAGMATSVVNAELLRVAMRDPAAVWGFYCDCILTDKMVLETEEIGDNLGEWKVSRFTDVQYYQPGFFRGKKGIEWKERSRRIPAGLFNWEYARQEWENYGIHGRVPVTLEEFVGISSIADGSEDWLSCREVPGSVWLRPGTQAFGRDWRRDGAGKNRSCEDLE